MFIEVIRTNEYFQNKLVKLFFAGCKTTFMESCILISVGSGAQYSQRDLAIATGLGKVNVSRACTTLERRGLLRRSPHNRDRRMHHLALTPDGYQVHDRLLEADRAFRTFFNDVLSPTEQAQFNDMLARVEIASRKLLAGSDEMPPQTTRIRSAALGKRRRDIVRVSFL
jgi:DNA-binding MarR family transcriptional regulator